MTVYQYGYAGEIVIVDLSSKNVTKVPTARYAERFMGGRGIAARIYWDETTAETKAADPENCIIFVTGPTAGFTRLAGCRWQICGKSFAMEPESFSYANLGASWGTWLKYAGYDGLVVRGESNKPAFLFVRDDAIEIRDASHIWGKTTFETQDTLRAELGQDTKVLAIGPAGENLVPFATVQADDGASGSSGFGAVMGIKRLKAIAVKVERKKRPVAAEEEKLKSLANIVYRLREGNRRDPATTPFGGEKPRACYGCISGCFRHYYEDADGKKYKYFCQATEVYKDPASVYYQGWNNAILLATRLCDEYGIDTIVIQPMITWLKRCYDTGILRDEETGLPLSRLGSSDFIEKLLRKIAYREGFGEVLAQGITKAAESIGKGAQELIGSLIISKANEKTDYDPRLIPVNAIIYAMEPRRPIQQLHATSAPLLRWLGWLNGNSEDPFTEEVLRSVAQNFWGSVEASDFSSPAGKALAAKTIQDYTYIKESLILCDIAWPIYQVRNIDQNINACTLESQIVSAITGKNFNEKELMRIGERNFNLQRAILIRQGWGGRKDDTILDCFHNEPFDEIFYNPEGIVPGKDCRPTSKKGAVIDRGEFEKVKSEYYRLRGWDVVSGFQTKVRLEELQLGDIAGDLEKRGLLR